MTSRYDLTAAANMAMTATGASLVIVAHESGFAGVAARADLTPEQAALVLHHLAEHIDGSATCCGKQPAPLRPVPPPPC